METKPKVMDHWWFAPTLTAITLIVMIIIFVVM